MDLNDALQVKVTLCNFLWTKEYNEAEVKFILIGQIKTKTPQRKISIQASKVIKIVLEFHY